MEVGFCFPFRLLPHCAFHALVQKFKLLLNRVDLSLPAFLCGLAGGLLLLCLIRLFLGQKSVELAGAGLLAAAHVESWEAVDVFVVVLLEDD